MDFALIVVLQMLVTIAQLALISIGLAVIFGMMRVINLAHGEFLMLGGFTVVTAVNHGVNLWLAMLLAAPVVVGVIGVIIERLVIRYLYGRMLDTMLATWGLSLLIVGGMTMAFGNTTRGVSAPLGAIAIGRYQTSIYELTLVLAVVALFLLVYLLFRFTRLGLIARATMQNAEMAESLGVGTDLVYAITFGIGAALSGLAGGLLAPLSGVLPTMGVAYVAKAFITVITGGAAVLAGTASASALLGALNTVATFLSRPVIGEMTLLIAAIILLRLLPQGITGRFMRRAS